MEQYRSTVLIAVVDGVLKALRALAAHDIAEIRVTGHSPGSPERETAMRCTLHLLVCLLSVSCGRMGRETIAPTLPSRTGAPPSFTVRVVHDTVTWQTQPTFRSFVAPVRFTNHGSSTLFRHWCASAIQKLVDGVWVEVQHTICLEGFPEYIAIAPGDSNEQIVRVYKYPDPKHPYGDGRLTAGTYRMVFLLGYDYGVRKGLTIDTSEDARATKPFVVRDP
jgi:hypothetical protein